MSWKIAYKTYGKDPQRDSRYLIKFDSAFIEFSVECYYVRDNYYWHLSCDSPRIPVVRIGKLTEMRDFEACYEALKRVRKNLKDKDECLDFDLDRIKSFFQNAQKV